MKQFLFLIGIVIALDVSAQTFTLSDLEHKFIQNNSQLLTSKFNIDRAQAEIVQEKLWTNPIFSISEVNFWKTYNIEKQPYLFGKYGQNQQISLELEQLIETAGKRQKRVAFRKLEEQSAIFDYEELLRELRKDLRLAFYELQRIQQEEEQLDEVIELYTQMNQQYQRQSELKNIAVADFYRIQTELISLERNKIELKNDAFQALSTVRILTHHPYLEIKDIVFSKSAHEYPKKLPPNLIDIALEQHIGLKRQENEQSIMRQQLALEKAQNTPDLRFQINYDRGGNIMSDFVGVGVSFDLPIFNRNEGNIKSAEIAIIQQNTKQQTLEINLIQTIQQLQNQLTNIQHALQNWPSAHIDNQKFMQENYKNHLLNKQVTLLQFIDFVKAYREISQAHFQLQQNYHIAFEELQHLVGQDL